MKVFFTTDLHGSRWHYDQLQKSILQEKPDILLLGGDQCPTAFGEGAIAKQQHWLKTEFRDFLEAVLPICKTIWASGNHDLVGALDVLEDLQREGLVIQSNYKWIEIGPDLFLLGFPYGPASWGWCYKDWERRDGRRRINLSKYSHYFTTENGEYREIDGKKFFQIRPSLEELLQCIESTPPKKSKLLLLAHYPPYRSGLDESMNGPIGSRTIFQYIRKNKFDAVCCGHVHESPYLSKEWVHRIGKTICINPGQLGGENLNAVIFDTEDIEGSLIHTVFGKFGGSADYLLSKEELNKIIPAKPTPNMFGSKKNSKHYLSKLSFLVKRSKPNEKD